MDPIENRVSKSGIVSLDLDDYYPAGSRSFIDINDQLWQGMVLKESDFRTWIRENDWTRYQNHHVAVGCSTDAIIPAWAYMLIASKLSGIAKTLVFGSPENLENQLWRESLNGINPSDFSDARIVIKGCGEHETPPGAFMNLVEKLQPVAKSIMYGEPCSTVPIWKKPK